MRRWPIPFYDRGKFGEWRTEKSPNCDSTPQEWSVFRLLVIKLYSRLSISAKTCWSATNARRVPKTLFGTDAPVHFAIGALGVLHTQEENREHALASSQALPTRVIQEMRRHQRYLEHRMERLEREALRLIARDRELDRRFRLMLTVPGIGQTSAWQILGELVVLSDTLDARPWVACSGIDPSQFTSGTSVQKRPRISRGGSHLRRALYMPALVAVRHEPHLRAFYQRLLSRGKAGLQAVVAVMRKLLHALFAMFRSSQSYDGSKLCPIRAY